MILYNASQSTGLRNWTRFLTNTNTSTYTNADLDASLNMNYQLFVTEILDAMDGWDFQGEIATTDVVSGQQEYVFPTDILRIKRIEVTYNGTQWARAEQFDINQRRADTADTSIVRDFSKYQPYADMYDNSIFLYPIPDGDVTGGLKIWYEKQVSSLVNDTDAPVFIESFHKGLCHGAAKDYFSKYAEKNGFSNKLAQNTNDMNDYIQRMKAFYRKKTPDFNYKITPNVVAYDYGWKN